MQKRTQLVSTGRDPKRQHGVVNTPIYHASTVTFSTVAELDRASANPYEGVYYGRHGTPTTQSFEEAVASLDGGYHRAISTSSGLAAIAVALLAYTKQGDHILVTDSVYGPTRKFCDRVLAGYGVTTSYYDPLIGAGMADLIQPNTKLLLCESPGSLTFEVQDIPALAAVARARDVVVALDNTWATPLYLPAFELGVDINIHAATKYLVGHADAMLGAITCRSETQFKKLKDTAVLLGNCAGPDACYLGLRGIRSLAARLDMHQRNAMAVVQWLNSRDEVERVLYPALETDVGYELWKRDFSGATSLFAVILKPFSDVAVAAMLDGMQLFAMGFSWGGYESLILPMNPERSRTATRWGSSGPCLRLHIGLEDPEDLIADLESGFQRLTAVGEHL